MDEHQEAVGSGLKVIPPGDTSSAGGQETEAVAREKKLDMLKVLTVLEEHVKRIMEDSSEKRKEATGQEWSWYHGRVDCANEVIRLIITMRSICHGLEEEVELK